MGGATQLMRAVVWSRDDGVRVEDRPRPTPGHGELLVRVSAAGINNADLLQARGHYPAPPGWPADVLGMELVGTVVACGEACEHEIGSRICAVVGGGAQAQYAIVPDAVAMRAPLGVDDEQLGALPEAAATAWDALVAQGGLGRRAPHDGSSPNQHRVLVTGAAGGVGSLAVQLAASAGAFVVASTRSRLHSDALMALGAAVVCDPRAAHEHGRFDLVLELVGGDQLEQHVASLATEGRIVVIGVGAGRHAELDLLQLMSSRGSIHGSTLRARSRDEHARIARSVEAELLPLVAAGRIRVPIHARFALEDVADAHEEFRRSGKLGKLVLVPA